jgi:DNA ligase-associated metallophosphoesterase
VTVAGEQLVLAPERAIYWPAREALLVADVHWGKAAAFQAFSLPVPEGHTQDDLDRLTTLLQRYEAKRLLILGDLVHAKASWSKDVVDCVSRWRARHDAVDMVLIRGNHDRRAGDPPECTGILCTDPPFEAPPFLLDHLPRAVAAPGYQLAGHVHPGVRLRGSGRETLRMPCFLFGPDQGLLPAFGTFTGLATVRPRPGERVFVAADSEVIEVA